MGLMSCDGKVMPFICADRSGVPRHQWLQYSASDSGKAHRFPELSRGAAWATLLAVVTADYAPGVRPVWRQSARQGERPEGTYTRLRPPMWPRVFRVGSWIAAALVGGLAALVGLSGAIKGDGEARGSGALLVILSLALLLASPLGIYLAVRRGVQVVAASVIAAVVVFGTFIAGALLILEGAY